MCMKHNWRCSYFDITRSAITVDLLTPPLYLRSEPDWSRGWCVLLLHPIRTEFWLSNTAVLPHGCWMWVCVVLSVTHSATQYNNIDNNIVNITLHKIQALGKYEGLCVCSTWEWCLVAHTTKRHNQYKLKTTSSHKSQSAMQLSLSAFTVTLSKTRTAPHKYRK